MILNLKKILLIAYVSVTTFSCTTTYHQGSQLYSMSPDRISSVNVVSDSTQSKEITDLLFATLKRSGIYSFDQVSLNTPICTTFPYTNIHFNYILDDDDDITMFHIEFVDPVTKKIITQYTNNVEVSSFQSNETIIRRSIYKALHAHSQIKESNIDFTNLLIVWGAIALLTILIIVYE